MTAQQVITEFNAMMNEADSSGTPAPNRWLNPRALQLLSNVLDEIWWQRRSAFNLTSIPIVMPTKPAAVGDTVFVQDTYKVPMAHYMAYLAFTEDSESDGNAKLAAMHYDLYTKAMG